MDHPLDNSAAALQLLGMAVRGVVASVRKRLLYRRDAFVRDRDLGVTIGIDMGPDGSISYVAQRWHDDGCSEIVAMGSLPPASTRGE